MRISILARGFVLALLSAITAHAGGADLALTGATLVPQPGEQAIKNATVVVRDGRISALGSGLAPPPNLSTIDVGGRVVTAGLWNAHVHFTDPDLESKSQWLLDDMLLRYGFTSVVDTGSAPEVLRALVQRIDNGELRGPRVLSAGGSFVYRDGTPSYLPKGILPELGSADEAVRGVNFVLDAGAAGIKIFSGSFQADRETIWLPAEIVRAVTRTAHARDAWVISHPTDETGLRRAVENGVDILAHTAPPAGVLAADLLATILENDVAVVPTLKLWHWELTRFGVPAETVAAYQQAGVDQLKQVHAAGGEILFGTDVGYMTDYDTRDEFAALARAGLDFHAILRSLTTSPATRFGFGDGIVRVGAEADLAVFAEDPRVDATHFADLRYTVRSGVVVYRAPES